MLKIGDKVVVLNALIGSVTKIGENSISVQYSYNLIGEYRKHDVIREDLFEPPYIEESVAWEQEGF